MDFLKKIPVPPRSTFNVGLTSPKNADMLAYFGHPVLGGKYRTDGKGTPVDNPAFKKQLASRSVGPFKAHGLDPALRDLEDILARVAAEVPDLYKILGTEGMLNARLVKIRQKDGSIRVGPGISNHTWGTAVDITLKGALDRQGDNQVLVGLLILSAYFNAAGWYWGAAFPVEDAMHFEVSRSRLAQWRKDGKI